MTLALVLGVWGWSAGAGAQAARPNIVVIVADDLSVNAFKALRSKYLPKIKSHLINRGVQFTNAFVSGALCRHV